MHTSTHTQGKKLLFLLSRLNTLTPKSRRKKNRTRSMNKQFPCIPTQHGKRWGASDEERRYRTECAACCKTLPLRLAADKKEKNAHHERLTRQLQEQPSTAVAAAAAYQVFIYHRAPTFLVSNSSSVTESSKIFKKKKKHNFSSPFPLFLSFPFSRSTL